MRAAGRGRIVNVSSMGGRMTLPGGGVYHASKYAVEALSDALRFETRGFGIGVSVVAPGPVRTGFAEEATAVPEGDGPYAGFMRGVAARNSAAYDRPDARGTLDAEDVAEVIVTALESSRPKARYPVGLRQPGGRRRPPAAADRACGTPCCAASTRRREAASAPVAAPASPLESSP